MKTRCVLGLVLLCLVSALVIAPGATPLEAEVPAAIGAASVTSVSGCFPVECNICCPLPGGGLVCTNRACV